MSNVFEKKGFSLIEVLIGLTILAIGILAVAGMQITSVRGNFFSKNMTEASFLAQDRLERLKNPPIINGLWPNELSLGSHDEGTVSNTIFSRSYNVELVGGGPTRVITMTVRWRENFDHSVSFSMVRSP